MHKFLSVMLATVVVVGLMPAASGAASAPAGARALTKSEKVAKMPKRGYRNDEILVVFEENASASTRNAANAKVGAGSTQKVGKGSKQLVPGLTKVKLAKGQTVEAAIAAYEKQPGVKFAQPNYTRTLTALAPAITPTDPMFSYLWGLKNTGQKDTNLQVGTVDADIDAPEAWGIETGTANTVVAVIDTGVDYGHPDLDGNMWHNPGEIANNGVDDDGNGYIDDYYGIDPLGADQSSPTPDTDPMDGYGHGTHCAGTIGGEANNGIGVTGVNWDVSIMAVKMFDDSGSSTSDDASAIECIEYATDQGADIISASWGGLGGSDGDVLSLAIEAYGAAGGLFIAAAGNGGNDHIGDNNDVLANHYYPAGYSDDCIIAVAATDNRDNLGGFSNYGPTTVDLSAPGVQIGSTLPRIAVPGGATVFSETFPSPSAPTWTTYGAVEPWTLASPGFGEVGYCAGYLAYENDEEAYLESETDINVSAVDPVLSFKLNLDVEPAGVDEVYDEFNVWVTDDDGVNWYYEQWAWGSTDGEWVDDVLDLGSYRGPNPIRIAFGLWSDYSNPSGVLVDNIKVTGTVMQPSYDYWNGTSMATPHVSGVAALLKSYDPTLTNDEMKEAILGSVDHKAQLAGKVATGGRLNAYNALRYVGAGSEGGVVTRISGADRFNVAASLARKGWDPANTKAWTGVKHIIVANGENGKEADPLSAAGLAGAYNAPVLTTQASRLPAATKTVITEIAKKNPGVKVHLIGGTSSLPDARWNEIKAIPGVSATKDRIAGADRYAVSAAIAKRIVTVKGINVVPGVLLIAADNAAAFYDALAVSPAAFSSTMPMLSVKKTSIPSSVGSVLSSTFAGKRRYAVSSSTYIGAPASGATRLTTSSNRYVAATQIANASIANGWSAAQDTGVAAKLPDALTGGAFIGKRGGVLLFTDSTATLQSTSRAWITSKAPLILSGWVLGGTLSVPTAQQNTFGSIIN